jgi:hypothetical protein
MRLSPRDRARLERQHQRRRLAPRHPLGAVRPTPWLQLRFQLSQSRLCGCWCMALHAADVDRGARATQPLDGVSQQLQPPGDPLPSVPRDLAGCRRVIRLPAMHRGGAAPDLPRLDRLAAGIDAGVDALSRYNQVEAWGAARPQRSYPAHARECSIIATAGRAAWPVPAKNPRDRRAPPTGTCSARQAALGSTAQSSAAARTRAGGRPARAAATATALPLMLVWHRKGPRGQLR